MQIEIFGFRWQSIAHDKNKGMLLGHVAMAFFERFCILCWWSFACFFVLPNFVYTMVGHLILDCLLCFLNFYGVCCIIILYSMRWFVCAWIMVDNNDCVADAIRILARTSVSPFVFTAHNNNIAIHTCCRCRSLRCCPLLLWLYSIRCRSLHVNFAHDIVILHFITVIKS